MIYAKFTNPTAGSNFDQEQIKEVLILQKFYEVNKIEVGRYHTIVSLKDFPKKTFNSVNFDFYEEDNNGNIKFLNIYKEKRFWTFGKKVVG